VADAVFASGAWYGVVYVMVTTSAASATPKAFRLVGVNALDAVRGGMTALPNAAADAAGGLVISDAGGLDADAQRADVAAILVDTGTTLDGKIDTIDTVVDAILVDTGTTLDGRIPAALVSGRIDASVGAMAANVITAAATAADFGAEVADAVLDRNMATGTDSGSTTVRTARQALRAIRNRAAISGGTLTVYKEDDSTSSWTGAVTTAAGDPIAEIDPAGP
jgi:hypothetical protein